MSDLSKWFEDICNNTIKPSLVYLVGNTGVGKKTYVKSIVELYNYRCININCLYDKDHSRLKKKTFVSQLTHMVTNRNIEYFLSGLKDVVIINNLHVISDKTFYDEILELKKKIHFVTPVVCILNKDYLSERFLAYITKGCDVFEFSKKSDNELIKIIKNYGRSIGIKTIPSEFIDSLDLKDGNIYKLLTQLKEYGITKHIKHSNTIQKLDKNIVVKCFDDLCNTNIDWTNKLELIKITEFTNTSTYAKSRLSWHR